ncbi:pyridoxal kinase-like protein [Chytriomyces sp. MP71]|nr:pyridoxal kinase-like protein [Chytriomyces sp. MP71]
MDHTYDAQRVLSVQSHVVHGHVGNKSATFPLQLLGFHVDPLNTVQFSNHTGYAKFTGERLEGTQIDALVEGLEANGIFASYSHLLTGYLGRPSILEAVVRLARKLKAVKPSLLFLMDPVLGDDNKLYVPKELVKMYRDILAPLADVVTPNGFEASLLTDTAVISRETAAVALEQLHALGPHTAIITSTDLGNPEAEQLTLFASHAPSRTRFCIEFPKLKGSFTGTGDLFAALVLARLSERDEIGTCPDLKSMQGGERVVQACELVVSTMQQVLSYTMQRMEARGEANGASEGRGAQNMRFRELCVIECRKFIENPHVAFKAVRF